MVIPTTTALKRLEGLVIAVMLVAEAALPAGETQLPLEFSGGHEIGPDDFGRPVVLIAAALGVRPDQFRKAFSGVTPARGGPPSAAQARKNKDALVSVLAPLGVTNERLDEVSNYYRYQPQKGELWKTSPAKGHAFVKDGKPVRFVVTDAGSGYSTPPKVAIKGMDTVTLKATLHFDGDMRKNGSVESVLMIDAPNAKRPGPGGRHP